MTSAKKAAYLSAFFFPGSGHVYLKCYLRAAIFIIIAAIGAYLVMSATFSIVWSVANDIEQGKVSLSPDLLMDTVRQSLTVYEESTLVTAKWAIIGSWLVSVIDSYREGKKQEA